jgi:hypothetical protein
MTLKYKLEKTISLCDWDDLVTMTYNRPYCLQQQNGCMDRQRVDIEIPSKGFDFKNETVPEIVNGKEMGVSFSSWLARDPKQELENQEFSSQLELWWHRNFYPYVQMVANDLHARGLIEAGSYVIDIDW